MKNMVLLKCTKRGSYILEAAIALPVFLIGILLLSSIIGIVARCENANYIMCDELERVQAESIFTGVLPVEGPLIESRIKGEADCKTCSVKVLGGIKTTDVDKIIVLKGKVSFETNNILDAVDKVNFSNTIYCRAFVGRTRSNRPLSESTFLEEDTYVAVYIFPNAGRRYHKKGCTYVNSYPSRVTLTDEMISKYEPCHLCGTKNVKVGDMVYCFQYGSSFHTRNCPTINKYVIEIDKKDAIEKGYTPCSKCGG